MNSAGLSVISSAGQVEICFGAPGYNEWRSFTLEGHSGVVPYPAIFPQKG